MSLCLMNQAARISVQGLNPMRASLALLRVQRHHSSVLRNLKRIEAVCQRNTSCGNIRAYKWAHTTVAIGEPQNEDSLGKKEAAQDDVGEQLEEEDDSSKRQESKRQAPRTVEQLLALGNTKDLIPWQAAEAVSQLGLAVGRDRILKEQVTSDPRLQYLLKAAESQISSIGNSLLLGMLRSLQLLLNSEKKETGSERKGKTEQIIRSLETELHFRLRRLNFKQLCTAAVIYSRKADSEAQKALWTDLVKHIELRWTEIPDARTVTLLVTRIGSISPVFMEKLEEKALEFAEKMTPLEGSKVALAFASRSRRSVSLFRALSYHFTRRRVNHECSVILDVIHAFAKVNFVQTQVLQRLSGDLLPHVPKLSPSDIARVVKSLSYLKWLHIPLFEAFAQNIKKNSGSFSSVQLFSIVQSFARLNYTAPEADSFFVQVHSSLAETAEHLDTYALIDMVWSLCILGQATPVLLSRVLQQDFYTKVTEQPSVYSQSYIQKLLHINSTANLEIPDYPGPFLPSNELLHKLTVPPVSSASVSHPTKSKQQEITMQSDIARSLATHIGADASQGHMRVGVETIYGWTLDAETLIDKDCKSLPVIEYEAPHLPATSGTKPLPAGARRLAFLALEYPSFLLSSKNVLGKFQMARRHISSAGFLLVEIPYFEWLELNSDRVKVSYLKDKISKAIAEDMAK
ncbi:FAST kinase domain-containing protein 4 [Lethenteron reissneri]|uniref:FAST kinase domain-containing protein 4 n=1 Tax=Lethenteron reissneri TaxID=7753 RepID=UPI002AB6B79E|nr:FAST kinase domain-containing protein 4 [Lethenteron reissneri]